jgi:hypothetical protein
MRSWGRIHKREVGRDTYTWMGKILSAREGETERELSGLRRKNKGPW